ncbi:hypothetical protein D3248_11530 [Leucobacter zeae]|nr:hypothetical protein [Leucobacter zeae]
MKRESEPIRPEPQAAGEETVLRMSTGVRVAIWLIGAGAGAGLGFALPWILRVASSWPIPYIGLLEFLGSFDAPAMVIGRPAVLGAIGLIAALVITHGTAELRIRDSGIRIVEGDDARTVAREAVGGVHRRGGKVRIESPEGRVLFFDDVEGGRDAIAAAFIRHGYPWEGDPPRATRAAA